MTTTRSGRSSPAQGPWGPEEDTDDARLLATIRSAPRDSRERGAACETLVLRYQPLVRYCAQRYWDSPESQEELMQAGYLGLLKAINYFDPARGTSLAAYAEPCVSGEIKRHFRDKRWQVRVKRSAQELRLELRGARSELTQKLARHPTGGELARHLGVSEADLRDAQRAELAFQATSLDTPLQTGFSLADTLGGEDPELQQAVDMESVWAHWHELPEREQRLLSMRFYGNMTQAEIGERLGISQMHVSRLLARALGYLRERLLGPDTAESFAQ
jgi:RNA polymerase sigma-B factor